MSLADHKTAALKAEQRAARCRERLQQLRDREPLLPHDVVEARDALRSAQVRALAASVRAAGRRRAQAAGSFRPDLVHVDDSPEPLLTMLGSGAVLLPDLTAAYLGLGGSCSFLEIDGYVHGALRLPSIEAMLLDQALTELI